MIKRVTFLEKRPDLTRDQFREHWIDPHGGIAARFAGLVRYHQNHLIEPAPAAASPYFVDGIVELWFDDRVSAAPGTDADVTRALVADEPTFLEGLTGFQVAAADPRQASRYKAWILARWTDEPVPDRIDVLVDLLASTWPADVDRHVVAPGTVPFTRRALRVDPAPPQVALTLRFDGARPSDRTVEELRHLVAGAAPFLLDVVVVVTEEIRIV